MNEEIENLKLLLRERDEEIKRLKCELSSNGIKENRVINFQEFLDSDVLPSGLHSYEISRYSRQLLLPEVGTSGQVLLKNSSVLIVGAGGLGCPVGMYLTAVGIGNIGIVDHDNLDISNLHRQIGHSVNSLGQNKSISLKNTLQKINPLVQFHTFPFLLTSKNIGEIIEPYEIIVDATDNVPTRYLLNDVAVLYKKVLVSGSALRFEGQITVYNYENGPCYRCLFPKPPPAETVTNCSEGGVLGVVTGIIGCLQALEVIRIALGQAPLFAKKMLLFDGMNGTFTTIKLRNKRNDCEICGNFPTIKELINYESFCNQSATDNTLHLSLLDDTDRISCKEYKHILNDNIPHILVDVRTKTEVEICCLPHTVNIPFRELDNHKSLDKLRNLIQERNSLINFVVCRRGNDSQKAVCILQESIKDCKWQDIKGGLHAWHEEVDPKFPKY